MSPPMSPRITPGSSPRRPHLLRLLSLMLLVAALGLAACVTTVGMPGEPVPIARAAPRSGAPQIFTSAPMAAAGMQVKLTVSPFPPVDPNSRFDLRYTLTPPDLGQGGCTLDQSQSLPGVNPVTLSADPQAQAQDTLGFTWPSALGSNQYYFCLYADTASATPAPSATPNPTATPYPGAWPTGELAHSSAPFFVTRDATPQIAVPSGGLSAGATVAVQVTDWQSSDHQAPDHVWLLSTDGFPLYNYGLPIQSASAPDASGTTMVKVTLPGELPPHDPATPALYVLVAGAPGIYQYSTPFPVNPRSPLSNPTVPTTTVVVAPSVRSQTALSPLVYVLSGLTLLIALGLVAVVIALALRARGDMGRHAMRQMGLDFEPLEPEATTSDQGAEGLGIANDTAWPNARGGEERQPLARPPAPPAQPPGGDPRGWT